MKNVVRAFVVALALTGFAASTQISSAAKTSSKVTIAKTSAVPIPVCPPDDPNACGMGSGW